jgi:uncharacterized Zn-finger protein
MKAMNERVKHFLAIAKQLEDGKTTIVCPFCGAGNLHIWNEIWPDGKKMDVYVQCPFCSEHTIFGGAELPKDADGKNSET